MIESKWGEMSVYSLAIILFKIRDLWTAWHYVVEKKEMDGTEEFDAGGFLMVESTGSTVAA